jgi:hypothetical protein
MQLVFTLRHLHYWSSISTLLRCLIIIALFRSSGLLFDLFLLLFLFFLRHCCVYNDFYVL